MPGYSATPLLKKLGWTPPRTVVVLGEPPEYRTWLGAIPEGVKIVTRMKKPVQAAHVFVTRRVDLEKQLATLRKNLDPQGFVWVSWPKKSAKVETDITEDTIRDVALPLDFVDIKVCAVSEIWSGLKLVIRKTARRGPLAGSPCVC